MYFNLQNQKVIALYYKKRSMITRFAKIKVEELKCPA